MNDIQYKPLTLDHLEHVEKKLRQDKWAIAYALHNHPLIDDYSAQYLERFIYCDMMLEYIAKLKEATLRE